MMESTEVRIGNLVHFEEVNIDENDFEKSFRESFKISARGLCEWHLGYERGYAPILLTKSWLLKLGFKEYIDFGVNTGIFDKMLLSDGFSYSINSKKVTIIHDGNKISHWINKEIKYVHQLQNLYFALTGDELIS